VLPLAPTSGILDAGFLKLKHWSRKAADTAYQWGGGGRKIFLKIYTSLTLSIQESYSPMRKQHGNAKVMKNDTEVLLYLNILI
jgi:hypothetical protein